jgi:hypothetical protein
MNKSAQLRNACLEAVDYCLGIYGDDDCLCEEMEFELYIHTTSKTSTFKRLIFNATVFTIDMLLSL